MAPRRALSQRLEELQAQLAASGSISAAERARLQELLSEARRHADGEDAEEEPQSLADRLRELTTQLEESHPNLTFAIGAVADALARLGI